jgi:hypothetical protein
MAGFGTLDVVLLATTTPERPCPASAPEVAGDSQLCLRCRT